MLKIDRFWADTLPQELLEDEEVFKNLAKNYNREHAIYTIEAGYREEGEF